MDNNLNKIIIIGPCSLESYDQIMSTVAVAKELGITYIRAQVYKPRTNPNSFQGMGDEGIEVLGKVRLVHSPTDIRFVCEVCSESQFDKVQDLAQVIQIGARNMQNFELLKYISKNFDEDKHDFVLLKRGFANTNKEWISSAEYLMKGGIPKDKIILCERGSRSITSPTGVSLDFINALSAQAQGFAVIIDPSHGAKDRKYVLPLAHAAMAMDFDGLMIEAHPNPDKSVSDREQAISLEALKTFFN
jgi:3-deoxy-7-phosphoheptulonate synthase